MSGPLARTGGADPRCIRGELVPVTPRPSFVIIFACVIATFDGGGEGKKGRRERWEGRERKGERGEGGREGGREGQREGRREEQERGRGRERERERQREE